MKRTKSFRRSQLLHTHIRHESSQELFVERLVVEIAEVLDCIGPLAVEAPEEKLLNLSIRYIAPLRRVQVVLGEYFPRRPVMQFVPRISFVTAFHDIGR